jgi:hypothetical protein
MCDVEGTLIFYIQRGDPRDSNLESTASKAGMLPLHHKAIVRDAGAGFEPALSTFREWRLYLFVYPAIIEVS